MSFPGGVIQSVRRAGGPAFPGRSPAGREARPGGDELRAAAEGGSGLKQRLLH